MCVWSFVVSEMRVDEGIPLWEACEFLHVGVGVVYAPSCNSECLSVIMISMLSGSHGMWKSCYSS